jgi:hypothetical protein
VRAKRVPHEVLRVKQPSLIEMALSTELITATASVPVSLLSYRPLVALLGFLLHGEAPSSELVTYFTTVTGLLFGFGLSNTFYFLCVRGVAALARHWRGIGLQPCARRHPTDAASAAPAAPQILAAGGDV